jgi:predicted acylesterase/phospholipase RssA
MPRTWITTDTKEKTSGISSTKQENHPIRILSVSGGGVWGISELVYIAALEKASGKNITDLFDFMVGTSVGGAIVSILASTDENGNLIYDTEQAMELLDVIATTSFQNDWKSWIKNTGGIFYARHARDSVDNLFNKLFQDQKLADTKIPISTHTLNLKLHRPESFSTLEACENEERNIFLKDAVAATSAAPSLFDPKIIAGNPYIDGGMFANNPTLAGYAELIRHDSSITPNDVIVVSLGTGYYDIRYDEKNDNYGLFQWLFKNDLMYILNYTPALAVQQVAKALFPHYHRLENFVPMDLWAIDDPKNIAPLKKLAEEYVAQNQDKIDAIVKDLTASEATNRLKLKCPNSKFQDTDSELVNKGVDWSSYAYNAAKYSAIALGVTGAAYFAIPTVAASVACLSTSNLSTLHAASIALSGLTLASQFAANNSSAIMKLIPMAYKAFA